MINRFLQIYVNYHTSSILLIPFRRVYSYLTYFSCYPILAICSIVNQTCFHKPGWTNWFGLYIGSHVLEWIIGRVNIRRTAGPTETGSPPWNVHAKFEIENRDDMKPANFREAQRRKRRIREGRYRLERSRGDKSSKQRRVRHEGMKRVGPDIATQ